MKNILILLFVIVSQIVNAQYRDTVSISLEETEKMFLEKNLLLLAQKYNIEEQKAIAFQTSLWDNPHLHFEINAYNPINNKYFDVTRTGQQLIIINQVIKLAGQRNKAVQLANINTTLSQYEFYDLLRTLKYALRTTYNNIFYLQQAVTFYQREILILQRTMDAFQEQYEKGNISLKEVVRLKSMLYALVLENDDVVSQIHDNQEQLNTLLHTTGSYYVPQIDQNSIDNIKMDSLSVNELLTTAIDNRYDLKGVQKQREYALMNLKLQKSLAVPDLNLGIVADRGSNFVKNYIGPNFDIDMPFFDRNQGNIQAAKVMIRETDYQFQNYETQVNNEIYTTYNQAMHLEKTYRRYDKNFTNDFDNVINAIITNFEKRNIGIVEFTDYYDAYKQNFVELNSIRNERNNMLENINFVVGKPVFQY
jgi:cobalt-zinc-cadmium efflux system outer membrane protein